MSKHFSKHFYCPYCKAEGLPDLVMGAVAGDEGFETTDIIGVFWICCGKYIRNQCEEALPLHPTSTG